MSVAMLTYDLMSDFRPAAIRQKLHQMLSTLHYKVLAVGAYWGSGKIESERPTLNLALARQRRPWFEGLWLTQATRLNGLIDCIQPNGKSLINLKMKPHKNIIQIYLTLIRLIGAAAALTLLSGCNPATKDPIQESLLQKPSSRIHLIGRDISNWLGALSYQEELEQHEEKNILDAEEQTLVRCRRIAARIIEQAIVLYPFSNSWEWDLHVLESDEFNANCRAGGKMIVNSYVLEDDRFDDHQVAIVIGHEIAHALLEHSRSRYGRYAVAVGGGFVLSQSFKMGLMRRDSLYSGIESLSLPIYRQEEREADLLGLALMTKAGFDPVKGANIWQTTSDVPAGSKISTRLELYESSHPTSQERLEFLSKTASQFAQSKVIHK